VGNGHVVWKPDVSPQAGIIPHFRHALNTAAKVVAVDMPIGFPSSSERQCESLARKVLGVRRNSVFAVPCRDAVKTNDYRRACDINFELTGKKFSKQAFMLFPKMNEIDDSVDTPDQNRVFEIHPEVSYWAMNGNTPIDHYKKTPEGAALRRELLTRNGFPVSRLQHPSWPKSKVAEDDILDACACAWSAARIARGEHISLPAEPEFDARGLRMQISA
jgi:predicted RNase H-like nuclease